MYVFGDEGGEWIRGLVLGFSNPLGTGGVLCVYLCVSVWIVVVWGFGPVSGWVG